MVKCSADIAFRRSFSTQCPRLFIVFELYAFIGRILLHLVFHPVKHGLLFLQLHVVAALGATAVHNGPLQNECMYLILENLQARVNEKRAGELRGKAPPLLAALAMLEA